MIPPLHLLLPRLPAGAEPPTPTMKAPPGSENILTVLSWGMYLVSALCVGGLMICGARMAISHSRGEGGQHGAALGWVMGGCILAGSAAAIVGALL